jgi:solute carrier family 25 phosphate transporter 23/24/25/41
MKILWQVQGSGQASYQGLFPTLARMWKEEGWRGYMRGNGTNCVRIVPYSAVQFGAYSVYKAVRPYPIVCVVCIVVGSSVDVRL